MWNARKDRYQQIFVVDNCKIICFTAQGAYDTLYLYTLTCFLRGRREVFGRYDKNIWEGQKWQPEKIFWRCAKKSAADTIRLPPSVRNSASLKTGSPTTRLRSDGDGYDGPHHCGGSCGSNRHAGDSSRTRRCALWRTSTALLMPRFTGWKCSCRCSMPPVSGSL